MHKLRQDLRSSIAKVLGFWGIYWLSGISLNHQQKRTIQPKNRGDAKGEDSKIVKSLTSLGRSN